MEPGFLPRGRRMEKCTSQELSPVLWRHHRWRWWGIENLSGFSVDDKREHVRLSVPQPGCTAFALGTPCMRVKDMVTDF